MKYLHVILAVFLCFGSSGCALLTGIPPEAKQKADENAKLSDAFVTMMDAGSTTREHEQRFIRASRRAWHAMNYAINDEPLPRDIEIWFRRQQLGMQNDNSAATPRTPVRRSNK